MKAKEFLKIGSLVKTTEYEHLIEVEGFLYDFGKLTNATEVCLIDNHSYSFDEIIEVWNKTDNDTYKRQYIHDTPREGE
jgi:hypothetical protein